MHSCRRRCNAEFIAQRAGRAHFLGEPLGGDDSRDMARELKGGVVVFEGHVSNPYLVCGPRLFAVDAATVSAARQILSYIDKRLKRPPEDLPLVESRIESPVDFWLEDDEILPDSEAWRVVFTPGHSEDSACFYNEKEKILFSGDTVVNYHGCGELNPFHDDSCALALSFRRLQELDVRHLYPGHGFPLGREDDLWKEISLPGTVRRLLGPAV